MTLTLILACWLVLPADAVELGVLEVDPVELVAGREVAGNEEISILHSSYRYRFVSAENKAKFEANPARYEIQLGGGCGRMGPLSGRGRTSIHAVHDGKIYIFASDGCRSGFLEAPEKLLDRDDPKPVATEGDMTLGLVLLDKVIAAVGGAERVDAVKSYRELLTKKRKYQGEPVTQKFIATVAFPARYRVEKTWNDSSWGWVATPDDAYDFGDGETVSLVPSQRSALERQFQHSLLVILRARGRGDFIAVSAGRDKVGETEVELLDVHFGGIGTRLWISGDGRVLRTSYRGRGTHAVIREITRTFSDFREVAGLTLPTASDYTHDGVNADHESGPYDVIIDGELEADAFRR